MSAEVLGRLYADGACQEQIGVTFTCPGCGMYHAPRIAPFQGGPVWGFNGDYVRPTLTPSLLVTWTWGEQRERRVCHSFITDGQIQFLSDCTHPLAGQTVPLPPLAGGKGEG